jgi:hypothetical protein
MEEKRGEGRGVDSVAIRGREGVMAIMAEVEWEGFNWRGPGVMMAGGRCAHLEGIFRLGNTGALRGSVEGEIARGGWKGDWGAKLMAGELVWRTRESDGAAEEVGETGGGGTEGGVGTEVIDETEISPNTPKRVGEEGEGTTDEWTVLLISGRASLV